MDSFKHLISLWKENKHNPGHIDIERLVPKRKTADEFLEELVFNKPNFISVLEFILKHIVNNLLATKTSTKEATITGETLTLDDILNINDDDVQFVPIFQKSSGNSRKRVRISRSKAPSTRGESVENPFADTEEEDNAGPSEDEAQEPEQDTKSVEKKTGQKRRERSSSSKVVFIREKKGSSAQEWQKLTPKSRQKAPVTNRSPSEDLVKIKEEKD